MILTLTIGAIALSSIALVCFWNQLRDYLNSNFRPWIAEKFGDDIADGFARLLRWTDDAIVLTRRALKSVYGFFQTRILRMKREFTVEENGDVKSIRTTIIKDEDGKFVKRVEEERMEYEDLPDEVRRDMIRQNVKKAELDEKEIFDEKIKGRAEEEQMDDLMEMSTDQ